MDKYKDLYLDPFDVYKNTAGHPNITLLTFQDSVRVSSTYLAVIPLIQYVTSFFCSFATNKSNNLAGRHITWVAGAALGCLAAIIIQFLPDPAMRSAGIFVIAIIIGEKRSRLNPHHCDLTRLQQLCPPHHQSRPHC